MSEGRLDSRELDTIVARDDEAGTGGTGPHSARTASRPVRVLRHPLVALLAVLVVVGAVLGARSYLVNRPPPLATTVDAKLGASFGDTGFITLDADGRGVLLSLVLRGKATEDVMEPKGFFGPGLADTRVHLDGERLTVTGSTDCSDATVAATASGASGDASYLLKVSTQDAWQRQVDADLPMPTPLGAQLVGTLRLACLALAARSVELVALEVQGGDVALATLANRGSTRLYLRALAPWGEDVMWTGPPTALEVGGRPVTARLVVPAGACSGAQRPRAVDGVVAFLTASLRSESAMVDQVLSVPTGSRRAARMMVVAPCGAPAP